MNLRRFLIVIFLVHTGIKGYGQITLNQKDVSLEEVLQSIEKQSGYVFLYTDKELEKIRISVNVTNASIGAALNHCFQKLPYTYKIVENNILLKKKREYPAEHGAGGIQSAAAY